MKRNISNYILILSAILFISALIEALEGNITLTGILLIAGFIGLATGVRGFQKLKGFSYTLWIFTAVTASMFYPQYFISIGNFAVFNVADASITIGVLIMMVGIWWKDHQEDQSSLMEDDTSEKPKIRSMPISKK